jgi:WD40 repeat protein
MTVSLWTLPPGKPGALLTGARREVRALAISPDSTLLAAAGADTVIHLYRLPLGTSEGIIPHRLGVITALAFTHDGQALAAGYDNGTLVFIVLANGEVIRTVRAHTAAVSGIAVVPGGEEIVTSGSDGAIRAWRLPWTKPLSQTTILDIPRVIALEKSSTDDVMRNHWAFLHQMLSLRFRNEIELCAPLQDAGAFDIQIAG